MIETAVAADVFFAPRFSEATQASPKRQFAGRGKFTGRKILIPINA
jgi:hypothetical protein